jgi:hypothetical protein
MYDLSIEAQTRSVLPHYRNPSVFALDNDGVGATLPTS